MSYKEAAQSIIKTAIKSAIFIDENALEPYTNEQPSEAGRTIELYQQFKQDGISLDVWKYTPDQYNALESYIFHNRDLVLLDWELEGEGNGGQEALKIISDIVTKHNQLHFCVVYTREKQDDVFKSILSYFSPITRERSEEIKLELAEYTEEINKCEGILMDLSVSRFVRNSRGPIMETIFRDHKEMYNEIKKVLPEEKTICSLIKAGIAFNNYVKPISPQPCPVSLDAGTHTLCIGNTFITALNKGDTNPMGLFEKLVDNICGYERGVMQLIGLEYRNKQRTKGCFIDSSILNVSPSALGYHKLSASGDFDSFVKNIMLEQESLSLRQEKLSIVEAIQEKEYDEKLVNEYIALNVFYNAEKLNGDRALSFGDVFKCGEDFYLCITALCDCGHPENREHQYYFAKGSIITGSKAMAIGEEGFVSFLSPGSENCACVKWNGRTDGGQNLPTYIVPEIYLVPNNIISNGTLSVNRPSVREGRIFNEEKSFEYVTTIKQNYAQRIANHAFSHPIRVGVDFVKYPKPDK